MGNKNKKKNKPKQEGYTEIINGIAVTRIQGKTKNKQDQSSNPTENSNKNVGNVDGVDQEWTASESEGAHADARDENITRGSYNKQVDKSTSNADKSYKDRTKQPQFAQASSNKTVGLPSQNDPTNPWNTPKKWTNPKQYIEQPSVFRPDDSPLSNNSSWGKPEKSQKLHETNKVQKPPNLSEFGWPQVPGSSHTKSDNNVHRLNKADESYDMRSENTRRIDHSHDAQPNNSDSASGTSKVGVYGDKLSNDSTNHIGYYRDTGRSDSGSDASKNKFGHSYYGRHSDRDYVHNHKNDSFDPKYSNEKYGGSRTTRQDDRGFAPSSNRYNNMRRDDGNSGPNENRNEDAEFDNYYKFKNTNVDYHTVSEIFSDLFELPKDYSLAHCVAEDLAMGSGIAVQFRRDFKRVDELYAQKQKQGGLAVLDDGNRFIYYLVTKRVSNGKPTLQTLFNSLLKTRKHIEDHNIKKLAMPKIGCGLDRLEWNDVKPMLEYIFKHTDVQITVCNFQQPEQDGFGDPKPIKLNKCQVTNVTYPLVQIEPITIVIYFGYEDGFVSKEMETLNNKFNFLNEYKMIKKFAGDIINTYKFNQNYAICGFIVNKDHRDEFNFVNFQKCVTALNKWNSKTQNHYSFVGIQAFLDDDDYLLMNKIVSLLRYGLRAVDIYVCWPGDLEKFMPSYG